MRYYIIFGLTLIAVLLITFYPKDYLMRFENQITVDYSKLTEDDLWTYEIDNDNLLLKENLNNKWVFIPNKNGKTILTFYYNRDDDKYTYKITYELVVKNNKIIWKNGEALGLLDYPNLY